MKALRLAKPNVAYRADGRGDSECRILSMRNLLSKIKLSAKLLPNFEPSGAIASIIEVGSARLGKI